MILFDFVLVVCLPVDCFSFYSIDVLLKVYADRFGAFLVQQTKTQRSTPSNIEFAGKCKNNQEKK